MFFLVVGLIIVFSCGSIFFIRLCGCIMLVFMFWCMLLMVWLNSLGMFSEWCD